MRLTFNGGTSDVNPRKSPIKSIVLGLFVVGFSSIFLVVPWQTSGEFPGVLFIIIPGVFFLVGGAMIYGGIHTLIARSAFHQAGLSILEPVPIGGTAVLTLHLLPRKAMKVKSAKVRAVMEELAIYRAGTDSRTYRDTIFEHTGELALPEQLPSRFEHTFEVPLPPDTPSTVVGRNNSIRTTCDVVVQLEGWPDLTVSTEIVVAPEVAA